MLLPSRIPTYLARSRPFLPSSSLQHRVLTFSPHLQSRYATTLENSQPKGKPPPRPILPLSELPLAIPPKPSSQSSPTTKQPATKTPVQQGLPQALTSPATAAAVAAVITASKAAGVKAVPVVEPPKQAALTVFLKKTFSPVTSVVHAYGREQRRRPWITQIWTALVIYFAADISAQNISGKEYDAERTLRSLIIGLGIAIPGYEWLIFLGNHFNYKSLPLSLLVKCIVAQSFYTPLYNTYFFGMQSFLAGDSWDEMIARIKATVPTSSINSCKLWPMVTAFSFAVLPSEYRNAFNGLVAIFWQTYLSYLNRTAEEAAEKLGKAHHGLLAHEHGAAVSSST